MRTVVLLSGGLDSLACLLHYRRQGTDPDALFIHYGQPAAEQELAAVRRLAQALHFTPRIIEIDGLSVSSGEILGRNLMLLNLALMVLSEPTGVLAIGIHAGTTYADCSAVFVEHAQRVLDLYSRGAIRIDAPFLRWRKREVWDFLMESEAPVALSYSCETGGAVPCGTCLSCRDRDALCSC